MTLRLLLLLLSFASTETARTDKHPLPKAGEAAATSRVDEEFEAVPDVRCRIVLNKDGDVVERCD